MLGIFEQVLKTGNKSGNSILRAFSDSGSDVERRCDFLMPTKRQHFVPRVYMKAWETKVETAKEPDKKFDGVYVLMGLILVREQIEIRFYGSRIYILLISLIRIFASLVQK